MTAVCFKKIEVSFRVANNNPDGFLLIHPEKGLIVTTKEAEKSTTAVVASYVLGMLDVALRADPQSPDYPDIKVIYPLECAIAEYFDAENEEALVDLFRACFRTIEIRSQNLPPEIERLSRISLAFAETLFDSSRVLAIDPERGIICTKDQAQKASCDSLVDALVPQLDAFIKQRDIRVLLPVDNAIWGLAVFVKLFFEKELSVPSFKVHELTSFYLPVAARKWDLCRAQVEASRIPIDKGAEAMLVEEPKRCSEYKLKVLTLPRDTLFTLQTMHHFVRRFATLQCSIGMRVGRHAASGLRLAFENGYFSYELTEGGEKEKKIYKMGMSACKHVARHGVEKAEPLIKELLAYKKDSGHDPEFYERIVAFLELNELQYYLATLLKEFPKVWFTCNAMMDSEEDYFHNREFLPRKEIGFLLGVQEEVKKCLDGLEDYDLISRYFYIQKVANAYLQILDATSIQTREDFFQALDRKLINLVDKASKKIEALQYYNELFVHDEGDSDDEDYEEYIWKPVTYAVYRKIIDDTDLLVKSGVGIVLGKFMADVAAKKPLSEDRGFLPEPRPARHRKVKRPSTPSSVSGSSSESKSESSSKGSSPELSFASSPPPPPPQEPIEEELTKAIAKLSFLQAASFKIALAPEVQVVKPALTLAPLDYAERVRRWYRERTHPRHPFNSDPDYKNVGKNAVSVILEHTVARWLDFYFKHAVIGVPLKEYHNAERRQLIISVTRITPTGKFTTKTGTITWALDPVDRLIYHRWFVKKGEKSEHFDMRYAEKAYEVLRDSFPLPRPLQVPPKKIERDGSYLEFQEGKHLVINDPKHKARIRVVLP